MREIRESVESQKFDRKSADSNETLSDGESVEGEYDKDDNMSYNDGVLTVQREPGDTSDEQDEGTMSEYDRLKAEQNAKLKVRADQLNKAYELSQIETKAKK